MLIDIIMLISGLNPTELKTREKTLKSYASPGTEIRLVLTRNAPSSVESFAEMELAAPGILERVVKSEREGADAVIIWGGHDPSVFSSRELVDIPIIGPGGVSMHLASYLSNKFALLIQLPNVIGISEQQIRDLGLYDKCSGIFSVGLPVLELRKPKSFDKILEVVQKAVKSGADSICFGCMALNDHADRLQNKLYETNPGVIVIHPGKSVIRYAEMLVGLNLSQSKKSFQSPRKKVKFPDRC